MRVHTLVSQRGTHRPGHDIHDSVDFRKQLKTHYFSLAFNVY